MRGRVEEREDGRRNEDRRQEGASELKIEVGMGGGRK